MPEWKGKQTAASFNISSEGSPTSSTSSFAPPAPASAAVPQPSSVAPTRFPGRPQTGALARRMLDVEVVEAAGLLGTEKGGRSNPRAVILLVDLDGRTIKSEGVKHTSVIKATSNPVWNHKVSFGQRANLSAPAGGNMPTLRIQVFSEQLFVADKPLGMVDISLMRLSADGEELEQYYSLGPFGRLRAGGRLGSIHLRLKIGAVVNYEEPRYFETPPNFLRITLHQAQNVQAMDSGDRPDPVVAFRLGGKEQRSSVIQKAPNPRWEEMFEFECTSSGEALDITVEDEHRFVNDFLGFVSILMADLEDKRKIRMWFDLKLKSGLPPSEDRGAIEITTQWFYNPNIAAKDKTKKAGFVPSFLRSAGSDTSTDMLLDKPVVDKDTATESGPDGIEFGASAMQGWQVDMENSHTIIADVEGLDGHSFVAVYDGDGDALCAAYAGENMMRRIRETAEFAEYAEMAVKDTKVLEKALYAAFLSCDKSVKVWQDENAYRDDDRSGSTAVASFVTPTHVVLAHAGDSRAVLASGHKVVATKDHKPYNDGERARIEMAGGVVSMKRVDGDLETSRALGHFQYKEEGLKAEECKVSPAPETQSIRRSKQDEFLLLACDGIWDVISNEDCTQAIREIFEDGESNLGLACEELLDMCLFEGSRDNMSAVLVVFPGLKRDNQGEGVKGRRALRTADYSDFEDSEGVVQVKEKTGFERGGAPGAPDGRASSPEGRVGGGGGGESEHLFRLRVTSFARLDELTSKNQDTLDELRRLVRKSPASGDPPGGDADLIDVAKLRELDGLASMAKALGEVASSHEEDKYMQQKEAALSEVLRAYCVSVRAGLCNAYLAASVVDSNLVRTSKTGRMGTAGEALKLLSGAVPVMGGLASLAGAALKAGDHHLQTRRVVKITDMATDAVECCSLARRLAVRLTDGLAAGIISTAEDDSMLVTGRGAGGALPNGASEERVMEWFADELASRVVDEVNNDAMGGTSEIEAKKRLGKRHLQRLLVAVGRDCLQGTNTTGEKVEKLLRVIIPEARSPGPTPSATEKSYVRVPGQASPQDDISDPEADLAAIRAELQALKLADERRQAEFEALKSENNKFESEVKALKKHIPKDQGERGGWVDAGGGQGLAQKQATQTKDRFWQEAEAAAASPMATQWMTQDQMSEFIALQDERYREHEDKHREHEANHSRLQRALDAKKEKKPWRR